MRPSAAFLKLDSKLLPIYGIIRSAKAWNKVVKSNSLWPHFKNLFFSVSQCCQMMTSKCLVHFVFQMWWSYPSKLFLSNFTFCNSALMNTFWKVKRKFSWKSHMVFIEKTCKLKRSFDCNCFHHCHGHHHHHHHGEFFTVVVAFLLLLKFAGCL